MIITHRGMTPQIDPGAYVAPNAVIAGDVKIGAGARIMFGAVINSEGAAITIGEHAVVSENAVIRATAEGNKIYNADVGQEVLIGPHSTVLGAVIAPGSYLATRATVLQGAEVRGGAVVTVGALVHANTIIPQDFFVPPHMTAVGDPVQLFSPDQSEEAAKAIMKLGFAKTAFDIDAAGKSRVGIYRQAALVRCREYETHFSDRVVQ